MTISISLVNVTVMDLWKNKNDDDDDDNIEWKEVVIYSFKVVSLHSHGGTKQNQ